MKRKDWRTGLRIGGIAGASMLLALGIACATGAGDTGARTAQPATVMPTGVPNTVVLEPNSTHVPRQHSGEHIDGLGEPVDAPHFVDSFPNHAQTLTQSPARVGINFDVALAAGSTLAVEKGGEALAAGNAEFDARRISMSAALPPDTGDGLYLVKYRACFEKETCTDGQIGFRVDSARVKDFLDLRGRDAVTIHLKDVTYQPNRIIVSRGTTVTWTNDDPFEHFVNSDPHPSHNAHPTLNSLDIPSTGTFTYRFDEAGEYAFHCSAHVPQNMFGTILVRGEGQAAHAAMMTPLSTVTAPATAEASPTAMPTTAPTVTKLPAVTPTAVLPTATPTVPVKQKVDAASLPAQRFAAHFVWSEPEHAERLAAAPREIRLDFNFTLARNSNMNVLKDGEKMTLGDLAFSENRLQMAVALPDAGAGTYHVLYRACWPDQSCHDGEFAFVVAQ